MPLFPAVVFGLGWRVGELVQLQAGFRFEHRPLWVCCCAVLRDFPFPVAGSASMPVVAVSVLYEGRFPVLLFLQVGLVVWGLPFTFVPGCQESG